MSETYEYYSKFKKDNDAFTIIIEDLGKRRILKVFNDNLVFQNLPQNLGNYFSWAAIQIKKYLKDLVVDPANGLQLQVYKCIFYSNYKTPERKYHAEILINLESNKDIDGVLYQ